MTGKDSGDSSTAERRRDLRVSARYPLQYYFAHAVELVNTKVYRTGTTHDVSEYGLRFEAEVLDASILEVALQGDVFVDVVVSPPGDDAFRARGKVVWSAPVDESKGIHLLGIQFVVADSAARVRFWNHASSRSKPVPEGDDR